MEAKPHTTKSEKTRQYIIERVAPVFNQKGVAGTSLSDLTRVTGLTKGAIYGNFKDKDAVAVAAFEHNVNTLNDYLNRYTEQQTSYIGKLLALPQAYRKLYKNMVAFGGCPIANTATEADDTHQQLKALVTKTIAQMNKNIADLIDKGIQAGEIQYLVDSQKTADIIFSLIEGGTILSKATGKKQYLTHSLDQVEYLIHSIRQQT